MYHIEIFILPAFILHNNSIEKMLLFLIYWWILTAGSFCNMA